MKVSEAVPALQKLDVTPVWRTNDSTDTADGIDESTIENEYVQDALPRSEGTAYVWVGQDPPPASQYYESLNVGC